MTTLLSGVQLAGRGAAVHPSFLKMLIGPRMRISRADADDILTFERAAILANDNSAITPDGQEIAIIGEFGYRVYFKSTALSTPAANSAATNMLGVVLPGGKTIQLAADANVCTATTGIPTGGVDGDVGVDQSGNAYYTKASGAWAKTGPIVGIASVTWAARDVGVAGERKSISDFKRNGPETVGWSVSMGEWVNDGPYVFVKMNPDAVTDNEPALTAAQTALLLATGNRGGTLQLDTGTFAVNNFKLNSRVRVRGTGIPHPTASPPGGTKLLQAAGTQNPIINCAYSTAGTSSQVMSLNTVSVRNQAAAVESIGLYGNTNGSPVGLLYLRHTSYFRAVNITAENTPGRGIYCLEDWDSRFYDVKVFGCGSTDGTQPSVHITRDATASPADDLSNQLYWYGLHIEHFPGVAFQIDGNNCGQVYMYGGKFESGSGASQQPHVVLNGAITVEMWGIDICGSGPNTNVIPALVKMNGCTGIKGSLTLKCGGNQSPLMTNWIIDKTSNQIDLALTFYGLIPEPSGGAVVAVIDYDGNSPHTHFYRTGRVFTAPLIDPAIGLFKNGAFQGGNRSVSASRSLTGNDYKAIITCTSSPTFTVAARLGIDFEASFKGTVLFTGASGVTVTESRSISTDTPWCSLIQTGYTVGAETYELIGRKL